MTSSGIGAGATPPYQTGAVKPDLRQQMSTLFQDIKSGNVGAAKADVSSLSQLLGGQGGAGASSGPFSALLGQVSNALSTGDIAGAQSALSQGSSPDLSQAASQANAANAATPHHKHRHGSSTQDGVGSLISAIQGGDLDGAQQALDSLSDGGDDDSTSATDGTSKGGTQDIFSQLIASVSQSLASSNIAAAQKDLLDFAQTQKTGSTVSISA